jgi:hypothetical protein
MERDDVPIYQKGDTGAITGVLPASFCLTLNCITDRPNPDGAAKTYS